MGEYQGRLQRFNSRLAWRDAMSASVLGLPSNPQSILDVGCGIGTLANMMSARWPNARIIGVEPDPHSLAEARKVSSQKVLFSGAIDIFYGRHDLITCMFVLGHAKSPEDLLLSMLMSMHRDGTLILAIPNQRFDTLMKPYNLLTGYRDDPTLKHRWTPKEFIRWLESYGLKVKDVQFHGDKVKWLPKTPKSLMSWMFVRVGKV